MTSQGSCKWRTEDQDESTVNDDVSVDDSWCNLDVPDSNILCLGSQGSNFPGEKAWDVSPHIYLLKPVALKNVADFLNFLTSY